MEIPADLPGPLVPLAWILGRWGGTGMVEYPTIEQFRFEQEMSFGYVPGEAYLTYTSQAMLLNEDDEVVGPLARETGYWRPVVEGAVEVMLAHPTGIAELWVGEITGRRVELRTEVVARTETATPYTAAHRLYGVVDDGDLAYASDVAMYGHPLQSHSWAKLSRVGTQPPTASATDGPAPSSALA